LDFPEVSLVVIFDADKEGFLRNDTAILQTAGRAARHIEGRVIMYADKITRSMKIAIAETRRRRKIQEKYNRENNIAPRGVEKKIYALPEELFIDKNEETNQMEPYKNMAKKELEREMKKAARELDFGKAAMLRDEIKKLG
jgi:excinuclease ABC subunit B